MRSLPLAAVLVVSAAVASPLHATCTPPSITITPANPTCGTPATLDAGSGWISWHWTDAFGYDYGTAQTMTTDLSGMYTVSVTDGNGCSTSASAAVTVNDFTIARAPSAACPNQLIQNIEIVGAQGTVVWSLTHGTIVNDHGSSVDVMLDGTGTAILTASVDNGAGCVMSKAVLIAVADAVSGATISAGSTTLCEGQSTTITTTATGGSGSYTYEWHASGDVVNATTRTITVSPTQTASYYAIVTDNYGCGSATTPTVQINVTPISAAITAPDNACPTATSTASAPQGAPGTTYVWAIDGGGVIESGQGSYTIGFRPGANGSTIGLTVTTGACSRASSKFVGGLPMPSPPTISASGPTTFCSTGSVTLLSSSDVAYRWSNGATTQSIVVNSSGSYSVSVMNAEGCWSASSQPVQVTVLSGAAASVTGGGSICAGTSATIHASLTGTAPFTLVWSDGFTQNVSSGNGASRTVSPSATTSYTLTSVSDATGCLGSSSGNANVIVRALPTATVSGSTAICAGSSATVSAALTLSGYPVSVTWSDGVTQQLSSGTTATRTVSPGTATTYSVTSIGDAYCAGTASGSATITVDAVPAITTQPASVTIRKNTTATLTVAASSTRPISYQWYQGTSPNTGSPIAGATSSSFTTPRLSSTTSYWVRVSNSCGFVNSNTATVTVH